MIRHRFEIKKMWPLAVIWIVLAALLMPYPGIAEIKYEYTRNDKAAEQDKIITKLKNDQNKIEMAIVSTKAIIDRSRSKPYLPELYLRLAELYIEKSRIVYFICKNRETGPESTLNDLEVKTLKNQAIEIYQRILGNFPGFKDRDKVQFFLAHEYRELGLFDDMILQYRSIIKEHPESHYVPEVYLLLGDYFFNEKQDVETAKEQYHSVLNYPDSNAVSIARYKLAWCYINKAQYKEAITLLEASVEGVSDEKADVDTYQKMDIRLESLIDMAFCYTEVHGDQNPSDALAYFQKYSWSRPVYSAVLEKLGYRYFIKKKYSHAVEVYRQLSTLSNDPKKLLEYNGYIFTCVKEMGNFEEADRDMAHITKALKNIKYSVYFPDEEKKKNITEYELYARDIVTRLHQKARSKKSVEDFKHAADSYKEYLEFFKESPVVKEMEINYAEALFSAGEYIEAGEQYEKLSANLSGANGDRKEKLYSAVLSYYRALKAKETLDYYELAVARGGLRETGMSYVQEFSNSPRVPEILFNIAWTTYDEGKYDEAISEFSKFVKTYPKREEAKVAVHLILDAYSLKEDFEGLIKYGQQIIANKLFDGSLRQEVAQIVENSESKIVSSLTVAAVNDWDKGKADMEKYVKDNNASSLGEQTLSALFVSSKEKGDIDSLFSSGDQFVKQYLNSPKAEGILGDLIDLSIKASQFRISAKYIELLSGRFPKANTAAEFLWQAGNIRTNLGQYESANKDYQMALSLHGSENSLSNDITFAMAGNAEKAGNHDAAINILTGNVNRLSKSGEVKAYAMIADAYLKKGNTEKSAEYREKAYAGYTGGLAKKDGTLNHAMAQMEYNFVNRGFDRFMNIQLNGTIDTATVSEKAKTLDLLEKGYLSVIQYQSPEWALRACYRSYEVNKEFSRFLKESPLPDLEPEQKQQYVQLIEKKSDGFMSKAMQYLETCATQAHKWEVCDASLTEFYMAQGETGGIHAPVEYASPLKSCVEIGEQALKDNAFKHLHYKLIQDPEDAKTLVELGRLYYDKGDFYHAILISQKLLGDLKAAQAPMKAEVYNILGMSYLASGNDPKAKEAFQAAIELDSKNIGANINLAGIYLHYGHTEKADKIYKMLSDATTINASPDLMHPHAKEVYYAKNKQYGK